MLLLTECPFRSRTSLSLTALALAVGTLSVATAAEDASAADTIRKLRDLPKLVAHLKSPDETIRAAAAEAIGIAARKAGDRTAVRKVLPEVCAALSDPSPLVRRQVIEALWRCMLITRSKIDAEPIVPPLAKVLTDADPEVAWNAAIACGVVTRYAPDRELLAPLVRAAEEGVKSQQGETRLAAAAALVRMSDSLEDEALADVGLGALRGLAEEAAPVSRCRALGEWARVVVGSEEAAEERALVESFTKAISEDDPEVRSYAIGQLRYFADDLSDPTALRPAVQPLVQALQGPAAQSAAVAATLAALPLTPENAPHETTAIIEALLGLLQEPERARWRGGGTSSSSLLTMAHPEAPTALRTIAERLGPEAARQRIVQPLLALLREGHPAVRGCAVYTASSLVRALRDPESVDQTIRALIDISWDEEYYVRYHLAYALGRLASVTTTPASLAAIAETLTTMLQDTSSAVAYRATNGLSQLSAALKDPDATGPIVQGLVARLAKHEPWERAAAAAALSILAVRLKDPALLEEAVAPLQAAFGSGDETLRRRSAIALARLATVFEHVALEPLLPVLTEALNDSDWMVASAAASSWGYLASRLTDPTLVEQTVASLIKLLSSGNRSYIRSAAVAALRKFDTPAAKEAVAGYNKRFSSSKSHRSTKRASDAGHGQNWQSLTMAASTSRRPASAHNHRDKMGLAP